MKYAELLDVTRERLMDARCFPPIRYTHEHAMHMVGQRLHTVSGNNCPNAAREHPLTEGQKRRFLRTHGVQAIAHVLTLFGCFPEDETGQLHCVPWMAPRNSVSGTRKDKDIWHHVVANDFRRNAPDFRPGIFPDALSSYAVRIDDKPPLLLMYEVGNLSREHSTALSTMAARLGEFALWITDYDIGILDWQPRVERVQPLSY